MRAPESADVRRCSTATASACGWKLDEAERLARIAREPACEQLRNRRRGLEREVAPARLPGDRVARPRDAPGRAPRLPLPEQIRLGVVAIRPVAVTALQRAGHLDHARRVR